jgi:hypothetical protein
MDPSESNLVLWIEGTLFLWSESFASVFLRVTVAWGLVQASLTGGPAWVVRPHLEVRPALVLRPALPPGFGPLLLWCSPLIQHDRDKFSFLGAGAWILARCEPV